MVTAESNKSSVHEAIKSGAASYVAKPFRNDVLLEKIKGAISK